MQLIKSKKYNLPLFSGEAIPKVEYTQEETETWYVSLNRYLNQDCGIKFAQMLFLQGYVSRYVDLIHFVFSSMAACCDNSISVRTCCTTLRELVYAVQIRSTCGAIMLACFGLCKS